MASTSALSIAISGLRTAQSAINVTSNNIANASTPGYTRKEAILKAQVFDGVGSGVRVVGIERDVNQALLRDFRQQIAIEGYLDTKSGFLGRVVAFNGNIDAGSNISAQLSGLRDKFIELSSSPESNTLHNDVVATAENLASSFNEFSDFLIEVRDQVNSEIALAVNELNEALSDIASFNERISAENLSGSNVSALEDQRDIAIETVAKYIDISTYETSNGILVVQTSDGRVLADISKRELEFETIPVSSGSEYPNNLSGVVLNSGSSIEYDFAKNPPGGRIGALLELRDQELIQYSSQLDELAHKTALRFNDQGLRLFVDSNGTIPANNPQDYIGIAGSIQVNSAILADPSLVQSGTAGIPIDIGDNTVINNIIDFTFGNFADDTGTQHINFNVVGTGPFGRQKITVPNENVSLLSFADSFITLQANDLKFTEDKLALEEIYTNDVEQRLLDGSAVNLDEEFARLIEFERAYTSSARIVEVIDDLFNQLLNSV